ncbi:MAG: hypothetical protein ACI87W_001130 [Halieaceae bacterium]|jgi:hypothetical protein
MEPSKEQSAETTDSEYSFWSLAVSRQVVYSATKVALVVGTILAMINHGEKIFSLSLGGQDLLKVLVTYCVPYSVSTWSAVKAIQAQVANSS